MKRRIFNFCGLVYANMFHSGHYHLVTHIQETPGYRPVILPGPSDSTFSTSSVNIHSLTSFLRPLLLLLSLWASLVLGSDSSPTSFNSSLAKCNPMNPSSSCSWCFRSYLSFLSLLMPQGSFNAFFSFFYIINRKHVHRHMLMVEMYLLGQKVQHFKPNVKEPMSMNETNTSLIHTL